MLLLGLFVDHITNCVNDSSSMLILGYKKAVGMIPKDPGNYWQGYVQAYHEKYSVFVTVFSENIYIYIYILCLK